MKMGNGSFVKERESLSCCDWFSMKLHEMMFRIKTFFDSDNNFHYGKILVLQMKLLTGEKSIKHLPRAQGALN